MTAPVTPDDVVRRLVNDLHALGVREGGVLLVHSSLRAVGPLPGGAETLVRGLLAALGPCGTLLMPALSYATVTADRPFFDVARTPSCVGALTEYFRTRAGSLRSVHPTHSVCGVGARAAELLADHELDTTPCGAHSPFRRLRDVGGQILFLGCGLRPNTSMHAVEELAEPPYLLGSPVAYRVRLADGSEREMRVRRHAFQATGWDQRYARLADALGPPDLREDPVLAANAHVVEATPMWEKALASLRRDSFAFVEKARLQASPPT